MPRLTSALIGLTLAALAASGCGRQPSEGPGSGDSDPGGSSTTAPSGDPAAVAIQIATRSAWEPLHVSTAPSFPDLVVYADGTFYGTSTDGGYRAGTLDGAELADLVDDAQELLGRDYGRPGLDGSTTTVTVTAAAGGSRSGDISVWVPSEIDSYEGAARDSRELLGDFLAGVHSELGDADPWQPEEWLLLSQVKYSGTDQVEHPAWPLTGLTPAATPRDDTGCQVITAAQARRVERVREQETEAHGWRIGDRVVDVALLPALPRGARCRGLEPFVYPV